MLATSWLSAGAPRGPVERVPGGRKIRIDAQRFLKLFDGIGTLALPPERVPQQDAQGRKDRHQFHRRGEFNGGAAGVGEIAQERAEVLMELPVIRSLRQGRPIDLNGLSQTS